MSLPLISILSPFKNTSAYLPECLDSICAQTYLDWELLIVDDNSVDNSFAIVAQYARRDPRIKLFKNPGNGIIDALNHAYSKSKGALITRMDSDDVMHVDKLAILSDSLLKKGKGHIALGQVKYFSEAGIGEGYKNYETWLNALTITGNNYSEIYKECVIPSPCWMLFREDLDKIDAFNPSRYPEDYDLTFRCYEQGIQCIPCEAVIHYWRDYPTRASRTHIHYAENQFLNIKLYYFLKLDHDRTRPLTVWGAGFKGKTIAKYFIKKGISFFWICDNPKKIGREIYGQNMLDFNHLKNLDNPQSIVTVANTEAQKEIRDYMKSQQMTAMVDYFFFC